MHPLEVAGILADLKLDEASIVTGLIRNRTDRHPDGMLRVALLGDPTRGLGSLAEPECARVIAARGRWCPILKTISKVARRSLNSSILAMASRT